MLVTDLVLPILIGIIASILLLSILYNNKNDIKQKFLDIGEGLLHEQNFNTTNSHIWMPLKNECNINQSILDSMNNNNKKIKITTIDSPLYDGEIQSEAIYNYYPQIPMN